MVVKRLSHPYGLQQNLGIVFALIVKELAQQIG